MRNALPHENLPFSASSISFPPILYWSLLQGRNVAHPLWSRSRTRHTLERKRKILHEANRGEESVASVNRSPAAHFQRRGVWKSNGVIKQDVKCVGRWQP